MAATWLEISVPTLRSRIRDSKELAALWGTQEPRHSSKQSEVSKISDAGSLSRENVELKPFPAEMTEDEKQLAASISREDELLKEGLAKLNLTPEESAIAFELAAFHQRYFVKSVHITGAGVTTVGLKVQTQLSAIAKRLDSVRAKMIQAEDAPPIPAGDYKALVEEEKGLMRAWVDHGDLAKKIFDVSLRAVLMQAMVQYRLNKYGAPPPRGKPGYTQVPVDSQ